jgi:hypothetical protein
VIKNGFVRAKQRFLCKVCGLNFIEGDARTSEKIAAKKAMCIIFYMLSKASFNTLAQLFDSWPSLLYRWFTEAGGRLSERGASGGIGQVKFNEIWPFLCSHQELFSESRELIVAYGELWPECPAIVIVQPPNKSD